MENNNQNKKNNKKRHHRYYHKRKNKKENEGIELADSPIEESVEESFEESEENLEFLEDIVPETFEPKPTQEPKEDEEQVEVIGVRFKKVGKVYYFEPNGIKAQKGQFAIVDTARGPEFGEVFLANKFVGVSETVPPLRPVLRIATNEDIIHNEENIQKEKEAFDICLKQIANHELDMKLVDDIFIAWPIYFAVTI